MQEEVNKEASMYTIRAPHVEFPAAWGIDCWRKVGNNSICYSYNKISINILMG